MSTKTIQALILVSVICLVNGKCPVCVKQKLKSVVTCSGPVVCQSQTPSEGTYDPSGTYRTKSPAQICTRRCVCSQKHVLLEVKKNY